MKVQSYLKGLTDHWAKGHSFRKVLEKFLQRTSLQNENLYASSRFLVWLNLFSPCMRMKNLRMLYSKKIRESRPMQKMRKKAKKSGSPELQKMHKKQKSASPDQCRKCAKKQKNPRDPTNA
jgi:hypothetical protein